MNKKKTMEKVASIVLDAVGYYNGEVCGETDIIVDMGADSIDIVHIATLLEAEFGISISEHEIARKPTIEGVTNLVISKIIE